MKSKALTLFFTIALLVPAYHAYAADAQYPIPSFRGQELQKVRQWENTWAGKKISSSNVDQVKQYLPESMYNLMKDTTRWGNSWFTIVPYQFKPYSAGKIKYTKQNVGNAKINAANTLSNWVAGVPFPETKDPLEMAWNFKVRTIGSGVVTDESGYIVDGRLKYDMNVKIDNNYIFYIGRNDTPPTPQIEKNPKKLWKAFTMLQMDPPETRNMRIMEVQYQDWQKPYDSWFWMPSIRRIRRRSTTERQDAQGGADFCGYDNFGWDGPIEINKYKYLGQQDLLMSRHQDIKTLEHTAGDCLWDGVQRERVKMHVIEAVNQDPNFLYTKMIWYLDPEDWQMLYSDRYDRQGRLWKVMDQFANMTTGYQGAPVSAFYGNSMVDVQRKHSTVATVNMKHGQTFPARMFTLQWMQKRGY